MQNEQMFMSVVHLWAATAWSDGVIAPNERRLLEGVIRAADVSEDTRETALAYLDEKVDLDPTRLTSLDAYEREGAYRMACRLTTVDREVSEDERGFLRRLAKVLDLQPDTAAAIEKEYGSLPE